ncbi:hypothetical protein Tco_1161184 [Tanacetum coccineum]
MLGGLCRGTLGDDTGATPNGIFRIIVGATPSGVPKDNVETPLPGLLLPLGSRSNDIYWLLGHWEDRTRVRTIVMGKEIVDTDLKRPFMEAVKTSLIQSIIEFTCPKFKMPANIKLYDGTTDSKDHFSRFSSVSNSCEWPMLVWFCMFQQTVDGSEKGWFENLSVGNIDGWAELRQQSTTSFSTRRACFKYPTKITKIVRKVNETLVAFKERWNVETVDEMMTRLDDFVRLDEAFDSTELPKGEAFEAFKKSTRPVSRREYRFYRGGYGVDRRKKTFNNRDGLALYRLQAPYQALRADH